MPPKGKNVPNKGKVIAKKAIRNRQKPIGDKKLKEGSPAVETVSDSHSATFSLAEKKRFLDALKSNGMAITNDLMKLKSEIFPRRSIADIRGLIKMYAQTAENRSRFFKRTPAPYDSLSMWYSLMSQYMTEESRSSGNEICEMFARVLIEFAEDADMQRPTANESTSLPDFGSIYRCLAGAVEGKVTDKIGSTEARVIATIVDLVQLKYATSWPSLIEDIIPDSHKLISKISSPSSVMIGSGANETCNKKTTRLVQGRASDSPAFHQTNFMPCTVEIAEHEEEIAKTVFEIERGIQQTISAPRKETPVSRISRPSSVTISSRLEHSIEEEDAVIETASDDREVSARDKRAVEQSTKTSSSPPGSARGPKARKTETPSSSGSESLANDELAARKAFANALENFLNPFAISPDCVQACLQRIPGHRKK